VKSSLLQVSESGLSIDSTSVIIQIHEAPEDSSTKTVLVSWAFQVRVVSKLNG
jgi:hypothetical protein